MGTDIHDPGAVETRLWREIENQQIGMLGLVGGEPHHFQPMAAFAEPAENKLWFFSYRDTDLAEAVAAGAQAMFVFQHGREFYACLAGELRAQHDPARMDKYWNPHLAAWYPEGKDDPRLTLLCFDARDAEVWVSEAGPIRYAFEIAKANATHSQPEVGGRANLNFH